MKKIILFLCMPFSAVYAGMIPIPLIGNIAGGAGKLKREASAALDHAGVTMTMFQLFLFIVTVILFVAGVKYLIFSIRRMRVMPLKRLLSRLDLEILVNGKTEAGTVNAVTEYLEKRFFVKKLGPENLKNMYQAIKIIKDKSSSQEDKCLLIDSMKEIVRLI